MKWSIILAFCLASLQTNAQRIFKGEILYKGFHGMEQASARLLAGENHRRLDIIKGDTLRDYFLILKGDTNFYHMDVTGRFIIKMSQDSGPDLKPVYDAALKDTTIMDFHCTPQKYAVSFAEDDGSTEMYVINWYATGFRFNGQYKGKTGLNPIEDSMIVLMQQLVVVSPEFRNSQHIETTFMVQRISPALPAESLFQLPAGYAVQDMSDFSNIIVTEVELEEIETIDEEKPPAPPPPLPPKKKKKN